MRPRCARIARIQSKISRYHVCIKPPGEGQAKPRSSPDGGGQDRTKMGPGKAEMGPARIGSMRSNIAKCPLGLFGHLEIEAIRAFEGGRDEPRLGPDGAKIRSRYAKIRPQTGPR